MKCPNCYRNQLRGKEGMQCKKCGYQFIFDPKGDTMNAQYTLNDTRFLSIIDKVSRGGTYYFTDDEFYMAAAKKSRKGTFGCTIFLAAFFGVVFPVAISAILEEVPFTGHSSWGLLIVPIVIMLGVISSRSFPSQSKWSRFVERWESRNGQIPGLIKAGGLAADPEIPAENDIFDYGAGQVIICEDDVQVDWLVLNGFHTQNGAIVVAESGYPEFASAKARKVLESSQGLHIYLLHNAGEKGARMRGRVESSWPVSGHQIIEVGVTEEMLARLKRQNREYGAFGDSLPVHALSYHHFNIYLSYSVSHEVSLESAVSELGDGDSDGGDGDFG